MVPSLRKLVDNLLEEISLCGDRGASPFDISRLIDDFYSFSGSQPHTPIRRVDGRPSAHHQASVDEKFKEAAWRWLTGHPEVSVGKACEGNSLTWSQAKATYNGGASPSWSEDASRGSDTAGARTSGKPSAAQTGIRVFVSEERMWLSIAGHTPDHARVPPRHFALLSIIAPRKGKGIVQSELTTLSGQDKRSVPKRTDLLYEKGYVEKRQIQHKAARTSLLILRKFAEESDKGDGGEGIIDFNALLKKLFQLLKEHSVIGRDDLKENMNMTDRWLRKVFGRAIRKLERIGCVRRVGALTQYADIMKKRHPSIMFIREPTEEDLRLFYEDSRSLFAHMHQNDAEEEEEDAADDDQQENEALVTEKGGRVLPIWTPERPIPNLVFDLVNEAGTNGITNLELVFKCFGTFYRRPLVDMITRLADAWPVSQPLHLRHFSLVRDPSLEGTISHFVHYTLRNFLRLAKTGSVSLESIEIKSPDGKKKLPPVDARPDVDQYGFLISDTPLPPLPNVETSLEVRTKEPIVREQAIKTNLPGPEEPLVDAKQKRVSSATSVFFLRRKIVMGIVEQAGGLYPISSIWYPFTTAWLRENQRFERPDIRTIKAAVKALVDGGKLQQLTFSSRNAKGVVINQTILAKPEIRATDKSVLDMQQAILNADSNVFFPPGPEIDPLLRKSRNFFPVGHQQKLPELGEDVTVTLQKEPTVVRLARARKPHKRLSAARKVHGPTSAAAASSRNTERQLPEESALPNTFDSNSLFQVQQWQSFSQETTANLQPYPIQTHEFTIPDMNRVSKPQATSDATNRKKRRPAEIMKANEKRRRITRLSGKGEDKSVGPLKFARFKRQPHRTITPEIMSLIPIAIAVIRALAGGFDGKVVNWNMLQYAFPGYIPEDLIARGKYELNRFRLQISKIQSDFQEHFLQAYAADEVPPINYDNLEEYDWPWLVKWAAAQLDEATGSSVPNLPNNWDQFRSVFDIRPEPPLQLDEIFQASSQTTIPRKRHLIAAVPFAVPVKRRKEDEARQANHHSNLEAARTWIRANVATSGDAYNPQEAGNTLRLLGENLISEARQSLVTNCVIGQQNRGRCIPGRNYDFTETFVLTLGRKRSIESTQLRRATHFKLEKLDEDLRSTGCSTVKYDAEDGDVLSIINLFANDRITLHPIKPPNDKYGLTEGGYLTRLMDKQKLRFDIEIRPVPGKYVYGNPLLSSSTPETPKGDLPDDFPKTFSPRSGTGSFCRIPLWFDIHGNVVRVLWESCVAATLGIIANRPGINAAGISRMLHPCLATWEVELLLQYLVSLGAIYSVEGGGVSPTAPLSTKEWWWLAIPSGDSNNPSSTDTRQTH